MSHAALAIAPLDVIEEEDLAVSPQQLSEENALDLYRRFRNQISVEFPSPVNEHRYRLRSQGFIGQIPLKDGGLLRLHPKISVRNVFGMLEYAYGLPSFRILEGLAPLESIEQIFEHLAAVLARIAADRIRKGLYREYVEEQDHLLVARGRIQPVASLRSFVRGRIGLECEFEEHTPDIDDNRILAWTLFQLRRYRFRHDAVRRRIRNVYRALSSAVEIEPFEPADCLNRFYHRLNHDYRSIHAICRFFLEHLGPQVASGSDDFVPFVLYMPNLFESFVARWLEAHAPPTVRVHRQYHAKLDAAGTYAFKIDLVLEERLSGRVLAVLDTKYKHRDKMDAGDIAQVIAYATHRGTQEALLVYPSKISSENVATAGTVRVRAACFDLSGDLEDGGRRFLADLLAVTSGA